MRFSHLIVDKGKILDLACGSGRHSLAMLELGHSVTAIDKDLSTISSISTLSQYKNLKLIKSDLEREPWPLEKQSFSAIIVTNYLYRPLMTFLPKALDNSGLLIYETFAHGNENFGRPKNPKFLLSRGELLKYFSPKLQVIAYEDITVREPKPAAIQRICARKI
tara:strand:- start:178 stop:669 length:492 start_codon:yes stop_codon:yes gene_type:complete